MLICDTHADTLYAMQRTGRSPSQQLDITKERLLCTNDVRVQALALFTGVVEAQKSSQIVRRELIMLEKLKENGFRHITRLEDAREGFANILLTIEGGEVFHAGLHMVEAFYEKGVRAAALVWNHENLLAFPAVGNNPKGLTDYGREVVLRMQALGMAIDVSHLNPQGVEDVFLLGGPPPMASHSCANALCKHPRNLTDKQLHSLFNAGGYVGVNFYPPFLVENGHATVDHVIDHMAHMCTLGGEFSIGMGSDFDGIDTHPVGLRHAGDVPALFDRMFSRGFGNVLVEAIAGGNFAAYMKRVEGTCRKG